MFTALKNFFKSPEPKNDEQEEEFEPDLKSSANFLTEPSKISKLLLDISKESPLCTITFQDSADQFSTSILDVNTDKKQLILDELMPNYGNDLLLETSVSKLSTYHDGIHLAFNLKNIQHGSSHGIAYYKANFPERVFYPQRRQSPRIKIKTSTIFFSGMAEKNNSTVSGKVYDISREGICFILANPHSRLQRGDIIKNCSVTLEKEQINFDLIVRSIGKPISSSSEVNVGGYFENFTSKSLNKINYFIAALERKEIRKLKA